MSYKSKVTGSTRVMTNDYLGGTYEACTKMKFTTGWQNNENRTNTSGFSGLPRGKRDGALS